MIALKEVKGEYLEAMQKFIETSYKYKDFGFYDLNYLGFKDGTFKYRVNSTKHDDYLILHLDPYELNVIGCVGLTSVCFFVGTLEYGVHY